MYEILSRDESDIVLFINKNRAVYLKIPGIKTRYIGMLSHNQNGQLVYTKELQAEHRFKKFDAFGFNERVIEVLRPDIIKVIYGGCSFHKAGHYLIGISDFNDVKKYLHFKKQGFELQCFIPISEFEYAKQK